MLFYFAKETKYSGCNILWKNSISAIFLWHEIQSVSTFFKPIIFLNCVTWRLLQTNCTESQIAAWVLLIILIIYGVVLFIILWWCRNAGLSRILKVENQAIRIIIYLPKWKIKSCVWLVELLSNYDSLKHIAYAVAKRIVIPIS